MGELTKRVLVAAVGIPLAAVLVYLGGIAYWSAACIISGLALWEFYRMTEVKGIKANKIVGLLFAFAIQSVFYLNHNRSNVASVFVATLFVTLFFVMVAFISELFSKNDNPINNIATTIMGVLYIGFPMAALIGIREFALFAAQRTDQVPVGHYSEILKAFAQMNDLSWAMFTLFTMGAVWICDSGAYFVGKSMGKHKLLERVSPKKSWEGAIGGFIFTIICYTALLSFFIPAFPTLHAGIIGALIGVVGQVGDLAESLLKRDAGVKDSSKLIPGHGGILDRFDSILFVAPTVYLYLIFITLF